MYNLQIYRNKTTVIQKYQIPNWKIYHVEVQKFKWHVDRNTSDFWILGYFWIMGDFWTIGDFKIMVDFLIMVDILLMVDFWIMVDVRIMVEFWLMIDFWSMFDFWIMFELLFVVDFWIMVDFLNMIYFWNVGEGGQTDKHTHKQTHQYHDSAWPKGRANWKSVKKCFCQHDFTAFLRKSFQILDHFFPYISTYRKNWHWWPIL